jgi:hypothetical protein
MESALNSSIASPVPTIMENLLLQYQQVIIIWSGGRASPLTPLGQMAQGKLAKWPTGEQTSPQPPNTVFSFQFSVIGNKVPNYQ